VSDKAEEYEIDPVTGIPRRIPAEEKRRRLEAAKEERAKVDQGKKRAAGRPRKQSIRIEDVDDPEESKFKIYTSKLPGGGSVTFSNPNELDFFEKTKKRYVNEYAFTKPNDLTRLSQLLMAELAAYRMNQRMAGSIPVYDRSGNITGFNTIEPQEISELAKALPSIQKEIRDLESALKIDKKTRDGSGAHEVRHYLESLKKVALKYGVHLSDRYVAYDEFVSELRWRLRVFNNTDEDDRAYHNVKTAEDIIKWSEGQLLKLEDVDKQFAKNKQALWMSKGLP